MRPDEVPQWIQRAVRWSCPPVMQAQGGPTLLQRVTLRFCSLYLRAFLRP